MGSATVDFEPNTEQKEFGQKARRFAEEVIRPAAARAEPEGATRAEIIRGLGELQMMGVAVPPEDGGAGRGQVEYVIALIEITKGSFPIGAAMFVNNSHYGQSLLEIGKQGQRAKYLSPCAAGRGVGSVPVNHPLPDPDRVALHLTGAGAGNLLSGRQVLIPGGVVPTHCMVPVRAVEAAHEISLLVVDLRSTPGLRAEENDEGQVVLIADRAEVPKDALLGEQGEGFKYMLKSRPKIWVGSSARNIGIGRAMLDAAMEYSLRTKCMSRTLSSSQAVQWALADTATALEGAELLALKAAWLADQRKPFEKEAALAKCFASDAAKISALHGAEIMGEEAILMRFGHRGLPGQENHFMMKGVVTSHLVGDLKGSL